MLDNAPETLQYLMGIHPLQVAQAQAAQAQQQPDDQGPAQATSSPNRREPLPLKPDGQEFADRLQQSGGSTGADVEDRRHDTGKPSPGFDLQGNRLRTEEERRNGGPRPAGPAPTMPSTDRDGTHNPPEWSTDDAPEGRSFMSGPSPRALAVDGQPAEQPGDQPTVISGQNPIGPETQDEMTLRRHGPFAMAAPDGPPPLSVGSGEPTAAENNQVTAAATEPHGPPQSAQQADMQGLRDRETTDRAELDRLRTTGSGVDQFMHRHKYLGPLVKGLTVAGEVVAPHVAALVPGTDLHHNVLVDQARTRVEQDQGDQATHQRMIDQEAADEYKRQATASQDELRHIRAIGTGEKFIAGSEKEDANSPTGYVAQNFSGEWKPYTPPQSYHNTKAEDRRQMMQDREDDIKRMNLQGDDAKFYRANGKLREPNPNAGDLNERARQRAQDRQQHEADLQMQRYNAAHDRWAAHKSAIEKEQETGYAKIEAEHEKKYGATGVMDKKDTDPDKQKAVGELAAKKKLLEDSIQQRFKEIGPEPQMPAGGNTQQPQAAQHGQPVVAPASKVQVKIGQQVKDPDGNLVYVTGVNPQTGKIQTDPNPPKPKK